MYPTLRKGIRGFVSTCSPLSGPPPAPTSRFRDLDIVRVKCRKVTTRSQEACVFRTIEKDGSSTAAARKLTPHPSPEVSRDCIAFPRFSTEAFCRRHNQAAGTISPFRTLSSEPSTSSLQRLPLTSGIHREFAPSF